MGPKGQWCESHKKKIIFLSWMLLAFRLIVEINVAMLCADKELSIDIPPESPLSSSKKSKKRKVRDGSGGRDRKAKRSKSRSSAAKGDKVAEISYEDGSEGEDEAPDVGLLFV